MTGEQFVEMMKKKNRDKLNKKRGGSIAQKLAEAKKRRKAKEASVGMGKGAEKVASAKERVREILRKKAENQM